MVGRRGFLSWNLISALGELFGKKARFENHFKGTVTKRVKRVVGRQIGWSDEDSLELDDNTRLAEDLYFYYLDIVELIMGIEEEFSTRDNPIMIKDEDAEQFTTIEDIIAYLRSQGVSEEPDVVVKFDRRRLEAPNKRGGCSPITRHFLPIFLIHLAIFSYVIIQTIK